ncbi:MAG: T9SS type A sorting domain-containing protein [bacterium]
MFAWNSLNEGIPLNTMVNSILVHNSIVYIGTNTGLYRYSTDEECWIKVQLELSGGIIKKMAADNQQLYVVVERGVDGEMLLIVDTGTFVWNRVALPYEVSVINDLSVINSELYLCCPIGLMKIPINQITFTLIENEQENKIICKYTLNQNYPNPFNPSTTFSFSLPEKEFVTLKIYDVLGKEITTLVNEELNAGSYKNDWNATNLSSGIYFYRLQAGKFSETKKLMLVK